MHDLVTDQSFDVEKTYEYILSIQVSLNGFSFFIESSEGKKLLAFKNSPIKISDINLIARHFSDWVKSEHILQKPFKKTRVVTFSEQFTLVPEKYLNNNLKDEIPGYLFDENSEMEIAENVLSEMETRLLFALPAGIDNILRKYFGEFEIIHPVKILLNNLPQTKNEYGIVLLFDAENFYILVFKQKKLLMANNFKFKHVNDVVFFVLSSLKQWEISLADAELFFANKNKIFKELNDSFKPYFGEIKKMELTPFLLSEEIESHIKQQNIAIE